MTDESLLDDPDGLIRADRRGLLRSVAASGAQVRTAVRAASAPLSRLRPEGRPGTVLLAGPGPDVPLAAGLLEALGDGAVRVAHLTPSGPLASPGALRWQLPRWAGTLDLVLITSADGSEPGLTDLLERAHRRGCAVATVAPEGSSLAELALRRRSLTLPATTAPHLEPAGHPAAPGHHWSLLVPLLMLGDRLGVCAAPGEHLQALAERLDTTAERCGPVSRPDDNPAKALASGCHGALPLLWSEGQLAGAVARHAASAFLALPGVPALTAPLPEALAAHGALLAGGPAGPPDPDDFFRDRVDDPSPPRARVVLLEGPAPADTPPDADLPPSAVAAARDLLSEQGVALTELTAAEGGSDLETAGDLVAHLDFTAVYLVLTTATRS
ncbi:SIS domain-containing protein [Streptomyces sp. SM14]|uniref:SIS domain-containing protein n=1 Tax=Streptomyces sp. SM14 TaxID=1736045 RepID=UPI000CD5A5AD|nr:SIS domain-containing protein [Streptomyces sp. SM14]